MSDDLMRVDEHRPVADGSRPLQAGQRFRHLTAELLEGGPARECWSVRYARYLSKGGNYTPPPAHCRLMVVPGDHYILWTSLDPDGKETGQSEAYCAPCAISEWSFAGVHEVSG